MRSYLHAQQLVPRYQVKEERNGIPCEVLYFGQCYLGRHLQAAQALYRRGLERSLLVEKLRELQRPQGGGSVFGLMELDDQAFEAILPALAEALHERARFGTDNDGYLSLTLDPASVTSELMRLSAATSLHTPPHISP